MLLLLLAILALSRPFFAGHVTSSGLRVIILDASASMQSTDETPSRFEKARAESLKLVDALKDQEQMLILLAAGNTEVKQSATDDKAVLRRAIQNCQVSDSPTRLTEALKLADTLIRDKHDPEIHLYSDGAAGDLSEFENKGLQIIYHRVGERCENVGITTLDIRDTPENHKERAIYTSIVNFSTNSVTTLLELLFDNQVVDTRPLTIPPGETSPQVFSATQERDGIFTVRIDAKDDLAADNQASMVSLLPQPAKVLLVSRGNKFMEKALHAAADVELTVAKDTLDGAEDKDVVVLDDVTPSTWPKGNLLAIHIAIPIGSTAAGRTSRPRRSSIGKTHIRCCATSIWTTCKSARRWVSRLPIGRSHWWRRSRRRSFWPGNCRTKKLCGSASTPCKAPGRCAFPFRCSSPTPLTGSIPPPPNRSN